MQRRCDRNRKRSKRRSIYCPYHGCYLHSVSAKYPLYTESPEALINKGFNRLSALLLVAGNTAVPLQNEWIEAFWCDECQETRWYHIKKIDNTYQVTLAPIHLWQKVSGVIDPHGNPSVSEFTRKQARVGLKIKDFGIVK